MNAVSSSFSRDTRSLPGRRASCETPFSRRAFLGSGGCRDPDPEPPPEACRWCRSDRMSRGRPVAARSRRSRPGPASRRKGPGEASVTPPDRPRRPVRITCRSRANRSSRHAGTRVPGRRRRRGACRLPGPSGRHLLPSEAGAARDAPALVRRERAGGCTTNLFMRGDFSLPFAPRSRRTYCCERSTAAR